ncbi:MAG TPA: aminotransferase class I/II-fold pyridoxal phosphate-dependent enzyme [Rubricoccaceae bacterium]|jgi:glycine C-acetyltransferase
MSTSRPVQPTDDAPITIRDMVRMSTRLSGRERAGVVHRMMASLRETRTDGLQQREILSPPGRTAVVRDHHGDVRTMLMFGANNYLGLATHPVVMERVREAVSTHGAGVGGPPLLNGYTGLHRELEERLAAYEHQEEALLYGSGYAAGLGVMSALPSRRDVVYYDADNHACFLDGMKLGGVTSRPFPHNDVSALDAALAAHPAGPGDAIVAIEGVYSMEGDPAPLDLIVPVAKRHGAVIVLDDAHGTGVAGPGGRGSAVKYGVEKDIDVVVGTFSKTFAVSGGFVACSHEIATYLRFFSRSYFFSASLPPPTLAAVLAGLDILESEPDRHTALMRNAAQLTHGVRALGHIVPQDDSAIVALKVPLGMDIRAAAHAFHRRGLFVNHVEYPAVATSEQRFRLSVSADHTAADIRELIEGVGAIWDEFAPEGLSSPGGDGAFPDELPPLEAFEGGF